MPIAERTRRRWSKNPDFAVAEVSRRLGNGDPATFGRACRRWLGMEPGRYRRRARAIAAARRRCQVSRACTSAPFPTLIVLPTKAPT